MEKTLIVSISGIRGVFGRGLDPETLVRFSGAFGTWCRINRKRPLVVIGRDGRTTGPLCVSIVAATLRSVGCDVIDAGMATTPTVEMAVIKERATGGIIVSASHNPEEWNALKLLNGKGEFLTPDQATEVIRISDGGHVEYESFDRVGASREQSYLDYHIDQILTLPFMDPSRIAARKFRVVVDGVNSVGGIAIPALLTKLGVANDDIIRVNCEPTGRFAHPAEPLPANLTETCAIVRDSDADLGIVVDPDADRLALIENGGVYVSEELTQVIAADFMWGVRPGPFVTNLSSSRAVEDVAALHGMSVFRSAVGEINVVVKMHEVGATLGGEGNGGVILPDLHHGRDALAGTAIVLQHLADTGRSLSEVRAALPDYRMAKLKQEVAGRNPDELLKAMAERHSGDRVDTTDGLKIDLPEGWVHMRKSNTEPIVRVYAEAESDDAAHALADRFMRELVASG